MVNSNKYKRIAILSGGISDERDISIMSASAVYKTLKEHYITQLIDVDNNCLNLINKIKKFEPDVVFNCLHGFFGEDGQIQSILNYLKIPYTHSGVLASSISMNKRISKIYFKNLGIETPNEINHSDLNKITSPIIAKPICGGSSNDLVKLNNLKEVHEFLNKYENRTDTFMFEKFVEGREITVGILNNDICGVMEIEFKDSVYNFENKYINIAEHIMNPKLPSGINNKLVSQSIMVHKSLGCNCVSRVDFRFNQKENIVYLLEINTQPGLTPNSLLPEMALNNEINFFELCEIILRNAECEEY